MNHDDSHPVDRAENVVIGRKPDGSLTIEIEAELCDEGCGRRVRYDVLHQTAACGCVRTAPEPCVVPTRPMVVGRLREALRLVTSDWPLSTPPAGVPASAPAPAHTAGLDALATGRSPDPEHPYITRHDVIPMVRVSKAEPAIAGMPTPSMCIVANDSIDRRKAFGNSDNGADWLARARAFYAQEAGSVFEALVGSLPGGTIDALLVRMLEHKRSMFVVTHDTIAQIKGG